MTALYIKADYLRAAMVCASTNPTRHYLHGVLITPTGHIVSTNGHSAFIGKYDPMNDGQGGQLAERPVGFDAFIVPLDVLKRVLTGNKQVMIEVTPDTIDGQRYTPVNGTSLDYTRIVPSETSGDVAQFNPDYIADMGKIGKLLTGSGKGTQRAHVHHNGEKPAGITFPGCDDAFAVLMPMRAKGDAGFSAVSSSVMGA